jgi:thiol-disulfide isomerase/thioredoxin
VAALEQVQPKRALSQVTGLLLTLLSTTGWPLRLYLEYSLPKGALAVINVWASWCSPCRAEEPTLAAMTKKYPEVNFLGILTRDNPVNAEAFVRKNKSPYPTLIDDSVLIGFSKSLPANAIPTTLVLDKDGMVAGRISGVVTIASLSELIEKIKSE